MVGLWKLTCMKKYYITLVHGAVLVTGCSKGTIQLPISRECVSHPPTTSKTTAKRIFHTDFCLAVCPWGYFQLLLFIIPPFGSRVMVEKYWTIYFPSKEKKLCCWMNPDGFSFSVFSSKYWNVYYVVQEEEWDETIFRRPAQIALGK